MTSYPQLFLDSRQSRTFDGRHPWVLQRSVVEPTVPPESGQIVELLQPNGSWIGRGIYNANSRIRVRLYQWDRDACLDENWLKDQLANALQLRNDWQKVRGGVPNADQPEPLSVTVAKRLDAIRLVNSEGDGLSGLIVDRFGDYLVVQFTAQAMLQWRSEIVSVLSDRLTPAGIHVSMDLRTAKQEGLEAFEEWVVGTAPDGPLALEDGGVKLSVDLSTGQKTGYYLDQRANRLAAARWLRVGTMLDVCCYQGGFSLAACAAGQATEVIALDSSEKALAAARVNAEANSFDQIEFVQADCFDALRSWSSEGRQFDNIVLDPPRMASNRKQIQAALRAYHRLNLSALHLLKPGGTLVSCSCSGRVRREDLWGVLASAAKRTRRRMQVLELRGADADHPIDINCPESDYLKCFICRVY